MDEHRTAEMQKKLGAMRVGYAKQLPDKIRQIQEHWAKLQTEWNEESFATLHRLVHSLTGSSATFGYSQLSAAAGTLEGLLQEMVTKGAAQSLAAHRGEFFQGLEALREAARSPDEEIPVAADATTDVRHSPPAPAPPEDRRVVLVDDDRPQAEQLAVQIGFFGYTVQTFPTLAAARQSIVQTPPAAMILFATAPEDIGLLQQVFQDLGNTVPTFVVSTHDDLPSRLQAVRAGCSGYLCTPLDVPRLIDKLDAVMAGVAEEPYRILIVDDSAFFADFYKAVLEDAGMRTAQVTDPLAVMAPLREFAPDLILMDVYMPGCSGLELAKVIRQQEVFVSIPIVYLSAESDLEKQLQAMQLGGDDFLTKPIEATHLVSAVTARVQRSRVLRSYMVRDSLTGLYNHTTIKSQLAAQFARAKRQGGKLAFAMLDIDHFKSVNDTYGHPTGDRVIRSLSRLLLQRLRSSDPVGRYGGEEFAVIFNDTDGPTAVKILDAIRADFAQIRHWHERGEFHVTLSAGVAEYPSVLDDPAALNEAADKALYEAKHGGRNKVALFSG
jgi:diguanylate cyclase (GGDEF)-like protein